MTGSVPSRPTPMPIIGDGMWWMKSVAHSAMPTHISAAAFFSAVDIGPIPRISSSRTAGPPGSAATSGG
jgi:hypothetical protein